MSRSTKPYLARALWEWCEDNTMTPLLHVLVEGTGARVPPAFVKEGQIILNISGSATRQLSMNNGGIEFNARFNGRAEQVWVPWKAVLGLFSRETGEGMAFPPDEHEWDEAPFNVPGATEGPALSLAISRPDQVISSEAAEKPALKDPSPVQEAKRTSGEGTTSQNEPKEAPPPTKKPTLTLVK
ncbi:ClpXP protease specificity-enhancing factor [Ferrovum sp.]|uniref:ClpXP protease specificity-enhancing factor n=1 Tax=Ferrovum sp. TaxID=2609467 RepID=UPI00262F136A|nr:ClpXP protease specificity-enhancing factor [Ferrovum sp.]